MPFQIADSALSKTVALPNGATSVNTAAIDLGHGARGDFVAGCEVKVSAPALATGVLGDGATMTYILQHADVADFSDASTLIDRVIVQTGAGGAGAAAATATHRLPVDTKRYVRARVTNSAAGNASASSVTMALFL